jgi:glycerate kinase
MGTVIVALDKFKGSIDAAHATAALTRGLLRSRPELVVRHCPVADGGDGTLDALVAAGFRRVSVTADGPTGRPAGEHQLRRPG